MAGSLNLLVGASASVERWRANNPDADYQWITSVDELRKRADRVSAAGSVSLLMLPGAEQYYPWADIKAELDAMIGEPAVAIDTPAWADDQLLDLAGWLIQTASAEPLERVKLLGAGRANTIRAELSDARNRAARTVWVAAGSPPVRSMGETFGVSPAMAARLLAGGEPTSPSDAGDDNG